LALNAFLTVANGSYLPTNIAIGTAVLETRLRSILGTCLLWRLP